MLNLSDPIKSLEERRRVAMLQADTQTLTDLMDPALVYLHSTGDRDSRASYLAKLEEGTVRYETLDFAVDRVHAASRTALVEGRMTASIRVNGQLLNVQSHYEAVWMALAGRWVLVAVQGYRPQ